MKSEYIDVKGKWGIVVCYDLMRKDVREMRALMEAVGMDDDSTDGYMRVSVYPRGENVEVGIDEALRMLLYHKNTGMCITNMDLNMSLVFIGEADSEDQWWDTLAHEVLDHAKVAILDYYRVPLRSEGSAWLTGYLMRKVVQLIAPPCA
jgi:hypothetical protein